MDKEIKKTIEERTNLQGFECSSFEPNNISKQQLKKEMDIIKRKGFIGYMDYCCEFYCNNDYTLYSYRIQQFVNRYLRLKIITE